MSLALALDSDKVSHQIAMQEQKMTCGPACAYMIECALKRMSMAGGESRISQLQCAHTSECAGKSTGTTIDGMLALLNVLGTTFRSLENFRKSKASGKHGVDWSRITVDTPALLLFGWYAKLSPDSQRNDGHYVVAARKSQGSLLVLLDPWFGLAEIRNDGKYCPKAGNNGLLDCVAYTA
jgi:hypothetical protein